MFEQFSDFLVENIVNWFTSNIIQGHRYRFHSDYEENIKNLVNSLDAIKTSNLSYEGVDLPFIQIGEIKLVYVNDVLGSMNENFISNLRDAIAAPVSVFEKCALLVLHKSRLDTVLNSAIDLSSLDAPLHSTHVKEDLENLLQNTSISKHLKVLMKLQTAIVEAERQSAFGYEKLYHSIIKETIYFHELSLLSDPDLLTETNELKIEKRLSKNQELHDEIEDVMINFPSEIEDRLSNRYSEEFINKNLTLDDWKDVSYNQLINEIDKPKSTIEFDSFDTNNASFILRDESSTAAGKRTKNLLIFCDGDILEFFVKFKGTGISNNQFHIMDNKDLKESIDLNYMGISRTVEASLNYDGKPLYFTLKLKGNRAASTFTFKILVLKKDAFFLEPIYNHFIIKPKTKSLLLQTSDLTINLSPETTTTYDIKDNETVNIQEHPHINYENLYNTKDDVVFSITNGTDDIDIIIEGKKLEKVISIPLLYNKDRLDKLFHHGVNAELNHSGQKAILNYQEIPLIAKRFTYVDLEHQIIHNSLMSLGYAYDQAETLKSASIEIYDAYMSLLEYFKDKKTTPSLCAWDDELCTLVETFTNKVRTYLLGIQNNTSLTPEHKCILLIGKICYEEREYLSPFSPLILSYILHLRTMSNDESFPNFSEITLERLNPKGLFPYLYQGTEKYSYTTLVSDDPLWLEFVSNEDNEFDYVSKLVTEKITEFSKAFDKLFEFRHDAPLIINSINNASNKELFKGLVDYYKKTFDTKPKKITINLYDQNFQETHFDIFADTDPYEPLKKRYKLNKNAETIIDVMRTHITYSKHLISEKQTYSHLSFFRNNEKVQVQKNKVDLIKSGLVCSGLISGESSEEKNGFYYSGFGLRDVDINSLPHLQMAKLYNALQRPAFENGALYDDEETITLMISDNFRQLLQQSYENSLWTVIIDPKVTLDFFDNERDLILIHYSDQYSSSANYDAITVTAQKELYADVVGTENIIREFNAFNGEWLIKMIAEKDERQKREKKGIIAAYKYMTAFVDHAVMTWVPLSIAELLRVAGNVGLSMDKSDFSRYNEMTSNEALLGGVISDDILLVGYCKEGITLYPVEVKSGSADVIKAIKQAKSLKSFFYDFLFEGDLIKAQILKGLFIRQLFMQIDKFKLYDVFDKDYFQPLIDEREELLNGTYDIVNLEGYFEGAVVFFNDATSQFNTEFYVENDENILVCKLPSSYQQEMLEKSYSELKNMIHIGSFGTNTSYLLNNVNCSQDNKTDEHDTSNISDNDVITQPIEEKKESIPLSSKTNDHVAPTDPMQITFGSNVTNDHQIFWYPTDTAQTKNTNTGIIGTMGTGKTQFTKSLVTQLVQNQDNNVTGSKIDLLIFDYKGDYIDHEFVSATNATVLKPFKLPYNPLALFGDQDLLPIHATNLFITTIAKAFGLGQVQKTKLDDLIMQAYEKYEIYPVDEDSWKNTAPTMQDVWDIFAEDEKAPIDSLYAALHKIKKFQIFEPDPKKTKPLYDVIDGVTVIKLSGYDSDIQNLIVAITLDIFYSQMHNKGYSEEIDGYRQITKMILVDEADNFMSQNFESLKKILKEGRAFGVGTILSTQQLTHFKTSEDNYAEYIQSWIVHQVATIKSQDVTSIFNISNRQEAEGLMEQIRRLEKHFSIYVDGNKNMVKMRDLAFWELLQRKFI
jgi:DNA phosphorothioation-dependent restriction protein DptH